MIIVVSWWFIRSVLRGDNFFLVESIKYNTLHSQFLRWMFALSWSPVFLFYPFVTFLFCGATIFLLWNQYNMVLFILNACVEGLLCRDRLFSSFGPSWLFIFNVGYFRLASVNGLAPRDFILDCYGFLFVFPGLPLGPFGSERGFLFSSYCFSYCFLILLVL